MPSVSTKEHIYIRLRKNIEEIPGLLFSFLFLLFLVAAGGGLLFKLGILHFFRTILLLYLVNFLLLPLFYAGMAAWKLLSGNFRNTRDIRQTGMTFALAIFLLAVFVYATLIEPKNIQIEEIEIDSEKVAQEFTLLHISDIQAASVGRYEQHVFKLITQMQPDIIVHTGDLLQPYFFKNRKQEQQKLAQLFASLYPKYGIYHVIGDVDWRVRMEKFDAMAGTTLLVEQSHLIHGQDMQLDILGLSLSQSRRGARECIKRWAETGSSQAFRIVLGHAPDYILDISDLDIDLCLAGHTHGGQIRIPFFGPIVTLSRVPRAWAMGYRQVKTLHVNVSAGIGAEHASQLPPIRVNCPPTMTLFRIKKSAPEH